MFYLSKIKIRLFWVILILVFQSNFSFSAGINTVKLLDDSELVLNGLAKARQDQSDYYLAALYLTQTFQFVASIDNDTVAKRMELKIVADSISARRFGRYWKEAISINNEKQAWEDDVEQIIEFTKLFKGSLKKGDVIDFDYIPNKGTYVTVNNTQLGRIRGSSFFSLLLMSWIGPRPPSESFKEGILGRNNAQTAISLQKEYQELGKK